MVELHEAITLSPRLAHWLANFVEQLFSCWLKTTWDKLDKVFSDYQPCQVSISYRHLTWMIAQEDFIKFSHYESSRSHTQDKHHPSTARLEVFMAVKIEVKNSQPRRPWLKTIYKSIVPDFGKHTEFCWFQNYQAWSPLFGYTKSQNNYYGLQQNLI